ncbi:hypothetical protein RHSIM_Rhsim01G0161300 [Rhododendron simsii]|uniref:Uncharacterized protein n=1 Tax=Rhododendron simsii TaxID=118357 RepID=A0A834HLU4_RHOSS|nr:hypothetical protein RHSIM_Rhsim01G0161300 [Rhododendron simsii]
MRARKKVTPIAVKKITDQKEDDDDDETQIKETEQEKNDIETPQKRRASQKSPVKKTQSRRITRSLSKREIRTTRVSKKMEATIEIKKKFVQKSNRNKKTGNEEDDDVVVLEEDDEEDEQQDVEEDEEESEEDEEEEKEDRGGRQYSLDNDGSEFEKDEEVKETNNDTNNLISDLLKEIDRLKEESKEKDKVIQTLQQKIAELERDHVPYQDAAEQMFDYETEVGTVHVEKGILQEEIVQKEVEIGGLYVSNDLLEEKLEKSEKDKASFEDGLDDIVTHMVTQEFHDKEEDKEKRQEEEESKEGEVDQTISERVDIATGLHDEILSDEVIDKTICQIFKDTQEGERKKEKKRKREQDDIDPPSMVKDLKGKDDRTVKTEEGFIYYRRNQKEIKNSNSVFKMTKLFNYISKEDMDLLETIYEFEKEDKKAFVWHNQVNNDTVTIEDVLNLLSEGDIGNTCIDGLTYILERREEKTAKTQGNRFYITSTCWKEYMEEQMRKLTLSKPPSFELISTPKPTLFPTNTLSALISSIDDAPQQQPGSVDCGIIMCYIIKQLAEQKPVPTYLTVENLKKFRAELIHMFLNDKPRTRHLPDHVWNVVQDFIDYMILGLRPFPIRILKDGRTLR